MPYLRAQILGEALGAFERGRRGAGAEGGDARRLEPVDQARDQRRLRPDHDEIDALAPAERDDARRNRSRRSARSVASSAMPALPGAQIERVARAARRRSPSTAHARARPIRPPEPACAHLFQLGAFARGSCIIAGDDRQPYRGAAAQPNLPEYTVTEIAALAQAHGRAEFLLCPGARRDLRLQAPSPRAISISPQGCRRGARRGVLARHRALALKPEDGMEVVCTGRLTTYPGRSRYQLVVESMELAGDRRAAEAAGGAQGAARRRGAVRRGAQEEAALPARR